VAQLSGYVSEHSAYHHGETSLQSTIVGLAQSFVGSNNINLLVPSGGCHPYDHTDMKATSLFPTSPMAHILHMQLSATIGQSVGVNVFLCQAGARNW